MKAYLAWLFKPAGLLLPAGGVGSRSLVIRVPGWETLELVSDRETLERINRETGRSYFGGNGNEFLAPLFGQESVFTLDGDMHRLARKLIAGALTQRRAAQIMPDIDAIVRAELARAAERPVFVDIGRMARRITMRVACLAILDESDPAVAAEVLPLFESVTGFLANIVSYRKSFWYTAPFPINRMTRGRIDRLRAKIDALIAARRARGGGGESVLDALLRGQKDGGYGDALIRDNLISTIAAGYDTTGSALSWTLFWLSQDGAFARLRARVADVGETAATAQFVAESLRYCPPLEILPRRPAPSAEVTPGVSMVCPCPLRAHHDPRTFDHPELFRPERFADRKYRPTEYFPFGAASRLCLGINIAPPLLEQVVARLLADNRWFRFRRRTFSPARRNVSLWPGAVIRADLVEGPPLEEPTTRPQARARGWAI